MSICHYTVLFVCKTHTIFKKKIKKYVVNGVSNRFMYILYLVHRILRPAVKKSTLYVQNRAVGADITTQPVNQQIVHCVCVKTVVLKNVFGLEIMVGANFLPVITSKFNISKTKHIKLVFLKFGKLEKCFAEKYEVIEIQRR